MFPIRDDQPRTLVPWVNYLIIGANLAVFGYEISLGLRSRELADFFFQYGVIPHNFQTAFSGSGQVTVAGAFLTILTSMFIHGSVLHLLGNLWVLWIFGDNIEDHCGHALYPIFYLICGFLASMAQIYSSPDSTVPEIGASGAIAGVLGAFLLRYPQAKVQLLVVFGMLANVAWWSAWIVLLFWFAMQVLGTVWTQVLYNQGLKNVGGVAYWAHVGGFVCGIVLIKVIPGRTRYKHGGWLSKEGKEVLPKQ